MQYQIFIKKPPTKKCSPENLNYEAANKGSSQRTAVHTINNKISKIPEEHPNIQPETLLEMSPHKISEFNLKFNDYFKENS